MRQVCVIGAGMVKFGRLEAPLEDLGRTASLTALKNAGVEWKSIQAAYCGNARYPVAAGHLILSKLGRTGISIVDVRAACASGAVALREAYMAIAYGVDCQR
jgi:acetyl-CoA acetyltransferase